MKAAFLTLGCKVNSYETEAVWELLQKQGYERVEFHEKSDVYLINTCTVTNNGDVKSRKMIREAVRANEDAIVVVMGCFSQLKSEDVLDIPGVKIVLGTKNRQRIPEYIEEYRATGRVLNKVERLDSSVAFDDLSIHSFERHQRAFLKIQDGCNNFCSYCIIPYARGRVRSKAPALVLAEAEELVKNGFKELILTGIHTGGYGQDLPNYRFSDLLRDLDGIEGLERIRISSIEISELTDDVLDVLRHSHKIVNHLHIPLQSGAEEILKAMNRKYDKAGYERLILRLRELFPDLAVTTDVIVGFPGETDEHFREMVAFIRKIGFSELHVFPFSPRTGTVAAKMKNQVSGEVKKKRVAVLLELSDELAKEYIRSQIGKTLQVIPETHRDGILVGHTGNYIYVRFPGPESLIGIPTDIILTQENYPLSEAVVK
jgi:threonylcarbamoyladenosine tRNA methylthiotransferase MtaB